MENFIIVLIAIAGLLYNVYKNYQKEMEKSKSRRPNARPKPPVPIQPTIDKVIRKETTTTSIERRYPQELPAEVIAAQQRRRQSQIQKPVPMQRIQEKEVEQSALDFDLRQAVIQSAILERPYK